MPSSSTLLVFAITTLGLIAIPGPANLYILARGIGYGRSTAIVSALGIESATVVYVVASAFGVVALLASSALAFSAIRWLGVAYLLYLGVRALTRRDPALLPEAARAAGRRRDSYRQGFLVGISNPKVALFFLAFFPQFVDPGHGSATVQVLVLGAVFVMLGLAADMLNALAASAIGGWLRRRPAFLRRQNQVAGVLYLGLGAWAAAAGGSHDRH
jgi:threonine/homoserine/homoserine lactone efflux protein